MTEGINEDDVIQEPAGLDPETFFLPEEDFPVADGVEPEETVKIDEDALPDPPKFDEKYRQNFEGLLYIGKVQRTVKWLGHEFVIKTMTIDQILEIGQLHQPYSNTVADIKAWQALTLAASIVSVDGQPIALPVHDQETNLTARFNYIRNHWYPWVLDKLYEQYLILDAQVAEVIDEMGKA